MKTFRTVDTVVQPDNMGRIEFEAAMLELVDFAKKCGLAVMREDFGNRIGLTGNRFQFIRFYMGDGNAAKAYPKRMLLFMKRNPK